MPPGRQERVVSLLPAATETLYALGAGANLVGVSHECDHPPAARRLPTVTRTRIDPEAPSRTLDAQVKRLRSDGQSLYQVDAGLLARLRPTVILTQVQCATCAVTPEDLEAALQGIRPRPRIVAVDGRNLEGVLADIRTLGLAMGREEEAKLLLFKIWRLTKEIRAQVHGTSAPRVAVLDWIDPPMFAGNWVPELCGLAAGMYSLVPAGSPSRWGSWEELTEYGPSVIVAAACGRSAEDSALDLSDRLAGVRPGDIPAVDEGRVYAADGHNFFNRAGPRLIYSAALLARAFHPSRVPPLSGSLEAALRHVEWLPARANAH